MSHKIIGIMASTKNGVIGLDGRIPWNYPSEFKHFQEVTKNHTMIMGRKTFDEVSSTSLLKNRGAIVFTHDLSLMNDVPDNIEIVTSLAQYQSLKIKSSSNLYMIGGAEIAELFLVNNMIDEFIFTEIHKEYSGDTFFPLHLIKNWTRSKISINDDYSIYKIKP